MNLRDIWLAKTLIDLGLYAAHGIKRLVHGAPKPEHEEPSMPLSAADVAHREAMIKRGARAFWTRSSPPAAPPSSKPHPDTPMKSHSEPPPPIEKP